MAIKGILWDSGDTLVGPVGGRWNPRLDFEAVLARHAPDAPAERFPEAFAAGGTALHAATGTLERDDYHRVILAVLDVEPTAALLEELDRPLDQPVLELLPGARETLDALAARGLPMAIVSDNWLGAERLYEQLGARHYFRAFITSAAMGCRKPDPRMYRAGADAVGLEPVQCLFIDDDPDLVAAAIALDYQGAVYDPSGAAHDGLTVVGDLPLVLNLLGRR